MDKTAERTLGSYVGRALRHCFGKGPLSVHVSVKKPFLMIYLQGFLMPMEKVLLKKRQIKSILDTRDHLMNELLPEITRNIKEMTGLELEDYYYDWSLQKGSGIIMGLMQGEEMEPFKKEYKNKNEVHSEIISVSEATEKAPAAIYSLFLNPRTLLIRREGILVGIEREFIRDGFKQALRISKRRLEKGYLEASSFSELLQTEVTDIFVDWNFEKDISYIALILKSEI